jgi:hypothetical protein
MGISDRQRLEFVARVTADMAHELRNVLAIVKETAGLIGDLTTVGPSDSPDHDKTMNLVARVQRQADRGASLTAVVHQLADSCEDPDLPTDLKQAAAHVAVMSHRRARKKRQSVQVTACDDEVHVVGGRLGVYLALHAATECCLDLLPESAVLAIKLGSPADRAPVDLVGSLEGTAVRIQPTSTSAWDTIRDAVADIGASLAAEDGECILRILFPLTSVR